MIWRRITPLKLLEAAEKALGQIKMVAERVVIFSAEIMQNKSLSALGLHDRGWIYDT